MTELYSKTIYELNALLAAGEVPSRELTESALARIDAVDEKVHAYITVTSDLAREGAQRADERIRSGAAGLLTGIPVEYETFEFTENLEGLHVHFYFNTVSQEEAGPPSQGPYYIWGGPRPLNGMSARSSVKSLLPNCA